MAEKKTEKDIGTCRFYESRYPDMDDLVMVKVKSIEDAAVYVQLLEYNGVDGMIPMGEVTRRRIRSIGKHLRVGKTEVVQVFRVDKEKGYIDLSKKRVTQDDIRKCEEKYTKSKGIHSIMMHVAKQAGCVDSLEDLYKSVTWPLAKKFGSAFEAFKQAQANPDKVFGDLKIEEELKELFMKDISERLKVPRYRIRAEIDVSCFGYEGVDAVKETLLFGQECGTEQTPLKITLVAPPKYVLRSSSLERDEGLEIVETAIQKMAAMIKTKGGNLKVLKEAKIVSEEVKEGEEDDDDDDEEPEEEEEEEDDSDDGEIMEPSQQTKSKRR
eukprot:TRINITY_DN1159_c3_g1_i1.p1 TRINITY_DN1159_c3_g1~~TRINITY_DN1159_c3_g1_i1.p1  ORF type:complete len:326 (+),score=204.24 TRINITY_DN1159_c3_g1_i1:49-1026(+)